VAAGRRWGHTNRFAQKQPVNLKLRYANTSIKLCEEDIYHCRNVFVLHTRPVNVLNRSLKGYVMVDISITAQFGPMAFALR